MARRKKVFVLDTNVILHDSSCIYQFEDNDIIIPIAVIEELDHFKKGNETVNFHAREFVRTLDTLSGEKLFNRGVQINSHLGKMMIRLEDDLHPDLQKSFREKSADHRILNCAYTLQKKHPTKAVILITKDVNLRMKTKSVGLMAQDYRTDHVVQDISALYKGYRIVDYAPVDAIDQLYQEPNEVDPAVLPLDFDLVPNEHLIVRNGNKSALAYFDPNSQKVHRVNIKTAYGISARNAEQAFALSVLLNDDIKLITLSGKAGTGKTLMSIAAALENRSNYLQIYIGRPIIPLGNRDIGYLPGDINQKLIPYMQPLYDNIGVIQNQFPQTDKQYTRIKEMIKEEKIKIEPLSYIRGRSLVKIFFIVDEAQNLTPHEVKTIITRAGEGTKIIFTGDIYQIDHPYLDSLSNGMSYLIERMKGQNIYAHVNLEKGERSELAEIASNLL